MKYFSRLLSEGTGLLPSEKLDFKENVRNILQAGQIRETGMNETENMVSDTAILLLPGPLSGAFFYETLLATVVICDLVNKANLKKAISL